MKIKYHIIALLAMAFALSSCVNDLNTVPLDPDEVTSETVYGTPESYLQGLAKLYGAFSLQGQNGGDEGEIDGVDGGLSTFSRALWNSQELPTDFALVAWKDDSYVHVFNFLNWTAAQNEIISATYYRITYTVTLINEYLKQTSDASLDARGTSDDLRADIAGYRNEARLLRAIMWSYGLDLFGNMPFVTEDDPIGVFYPEQISRADLFAYVESELLEVEALLPEPKSVEFGHIVRGAAWGYLSRLYLNSEVYTGEARYSDACTWAKKVIDSGAYSLATSYAELFMGDNNNTNPDVWAELIFTGVYDNNYAQTWGGTTFLTSGSRQTDPLVYGALEGWAGIRARPELPQLFPNYEEQGEDGYVASPDGRCIMYSNGYSLGVDDPWDFTNGYSVYKWSARFSDGTYPTGNEKFASTDWIFMRYAEILLNYAEAAVRGGGDTGLALQYINEMRERAYGSTDGNITSGDLSVNFMLDERGRELYWEGFRRSDLVRFGKFSGSSYNWAWKGYVLEGTGVGSQYDLYPIPYTDLVANPNLVQNPGY